MALTLDRIALEDVGAEPQRLAEAILAQIQYRHGRVPIAAIAHALGIAEIRQEPLNNLEGCLVTTAERSSGVILLNSNSPRPRRNFTLGHEVGHFMNPYHDGAGGMRYSCSSADLRASPAADRARRHEAEASRFAIEILAPRTRCKALIGHEPDIADIIAMANEFDISKEASARRYVELHNRPMAVVFGKAGRLIYSVRSKTCPALIVQRSDVLPLPKKKPGFGGLTEMIPANVSAWFDRDNCELLVQSSFQQKGYSMVLLHLLPEEEDETDIEDSYDRFMSLNERR